MEPVLADDARGCDPPAGLISLVADVVPRILLIDQSWSSFTRAILLALAAAFPVLAATPVAATPFTFVVLGDMPYGEPERVYPAFRTLIATINRRAPELVIHVGDTKAGRGLCSDELLKAQLYFLNSFEGAAIYTPGDNEWTDCHTDKAGGFDPLERLAHIRATYFAESATSFGKAPVEVESQALIMADTHGGFPENVRLARHGVHFVTAHVVGSNDNLAPGTPSSVREHHARDAANVAWLFDSFEKAKAAGAKALVLAIHGDMFMFDYDTIDKEGFQEPSGFRLFGESLRSLAAAFGRPVLLVFGDSHLYRVFRPFRRSAGNLVALETFGDRDMHAVEVLVDPDDPAVFAYRPPLNPALDDGH